MVVIQVHTGIEIVPFTFAPFIGLVDNESCSSKYRGFRYQRKKQVSKASYPIVNGHGAHVDTEKLVKEQGAITKSHTEVYTHNQDEADNSGREMTIREIDFWFSW